MLTMHRTLHSEPMGGRSPSPALRTITESQPAQLVMVICVLLLLAGCGAQQVSEPPTAGNGGTATMSMSQAARADDPRDPPPPLNIVFQVDVYQVAVPFGTFSGNEQFWRRINEQCVDVATYDLLYRNGIRVGEAPVAELQTFRKYISEVLPAQKITVTATEVKNVEIEMKKDLPEQVIFHFDSSNRPVGYSFDRCENYMTISFQPTPRKPGYLRMTLCPMVRSQRRVLQFSPNNEEREFAFTSPERFYELNMRVDIPRDGFLVVTASADAKRPTSIGRAFFTVDGPAERMEQVLLVIPKPYIP